MSSSGKASQKRNLSNEQIDELVEKMSNDERLELLDKIETCGKEMTMTRGLPITGAVLGSLYLARTRLPAQFGAKRWPFYAIMGIATLTASTCLSMETCSDRIEPRIKQLWKKYEVVPSTTSYEGTICTTKRCYNISVEETSEFEQSPSPPPSFSFSAKQSFISKKPSGQPASSSD